MSEVTRRNFLKLAGAGSAALAAMSAGVAGVGRVIGFGAAGSSAPRAAPVMFRATAGLPQRPYPAYASLVFEGSVDPAAGTGTLRRSVFAGAPEAMSGILLPGTERSYNVTGVTGDGGTLLVRAMADNSGVLGAGESPSILVRIDRMTGVVKAPFADRQLELQLAG
jgi:hypothetical protein